MYIARLDAPFGVEVRDPDLARLRQALAEHQVLVLRGPCSEDEHVQLVQAIGRVLPQGPRVQVGDERPAVEPPLVIGLPEVAAALANHHEFAYLDDPIDGVSLYADEVGEGSAPTRFTSGVLAYAALPPRLKERLHQLQGLFVAQYDPAIRAQAGRHRDRDVDPRFPRAVHPLVVRHPQTGQNVLYVNHTQVDRVLGLGDDESESLLQELFGYLYRPDNTYEHSYRNGDLVIWDNLSVQHGRDATPPGVARRLRRVVFGSRAPWESWPGVPDL